MKWKTKKTRWLLPVCLLLFLIQIKAYAYASDGEGYITISVDAQDDNGNLKYAIDTDDPSAFTDSNEFRIPEGTSHTIYVKDVAGNITSQTYEPAGSSNTPTPPETVTAGNGNEGKINIEVEIGDKQDSSNTVTKTDYSNYEYLTDDPVEPGGATVAEKIKTDGSDNAEKVFYTFQTKEGETLYLVIDQGQSADNVYLLDTVSINDLMVLADGAAPQQLEEKEDNLLSALAKQEDTGGASGEKEEASSNSNLFIVFFVVIVFAGAYYYFKIYKPKKEESMDSIDDAMDMDEFEAEPDEDEIDFEVDDAEKEAFLEQLINDEENLYDADPEEYTAAYMENTGEGLDAGIEFPEDDNAAGAGETFEDYEEMEMDFMDDGFGEEDFMEMNEDGKEM